MEELIKESKKSKLRIYAKELYAKRKLEGVCTYCGKVPSSPGRVFCAACTFKQRKTEQSKLDSLKLSKTCRYCKSPCETANICSTCRGTHNSTRKVFRRSVIDKGLCPICKTPVTDGVNCPPCQGTLRIKTAEARLARKESGRCQRCTLPSVSGTKCLEHWMSDICNTTLGDRTKVPDLLQLWNIQNGRCVVTGCALLPGVNASLDHIIPVSKGGTNGLTNLRWVCWTINQLKGNILPETLLGICRLILGIGTLSNMPKSVVRELESRKRFGIGGIDERY